jgi:hypothetical protein
MIMARIEAEQIRNCLGKYCTLKGTLRVASESDCKFHATECGIELKILDLQLYDELLAAVPCLLGGKYLYDDEASITGLLQQIDCLIVFEKISNVQVRRNEKVYAFDVA